jgi:uncharacterized protein
VEFDDDAQLDTSQVEDTRGYGGGGGMGLGGMVGWGGGGLGILGLIAYFVFANLVGHHGGTGNPLSLDGVGSGQQVDSGQLAGECRTGRDANTKPDCTVVALVNSVQGYWKDQLARSGRTYRVAPTRFFRGGVRTGCGSDSSDSGPFYCPADRTVYIDLSFFKELQTRFGAQGGPFVEGYVLAHEYGHHVQNLLGTEARVKTRQGPTSDSVRLELQADCYAGVWADHATSTPTASGKPLVKTITQQDIAGALDAASRIGDDFIQRNLGSGQVNSSQFTHGTSAQREKWFTTGVQTGDPARCDTFGATNLG